MFITKQDLNTDNTLIHESLDSPLNAMYTLLNEAEGDEAEDDIDDGTVDDSEADTDEDETTDELPADDETVDDSTDEIGDSGADAPASIKNIENKKIASVYKNIYRQSKIIKKQIQLANTMYNMFDAETKSEERNFVTSIIGELQIMLDQINMLNDEDFVITNYQTILTLYIYIDTVTKTSTNFLEKFAKFFISDKTNKASS